MLLVHYTQQSTKYVLELILSLQQVGKIIQQRGMISLLNLWRMILTTSKKMLRWSLLLHQQLWGNLAAIDENSSSPIESIDNTSRHGEEISRLVRPVAKRATSDDMSAFARELKVGPNSSEDADSDNSSLQVLHLDSNIISYDSDRTASSSSEPKGRQTFNSTALRQTEISLTGTKEGRNLYHLHA